MCGIMAYAGTGRAAEIIYGGLQQLEYRGYDSAGMAVLNGDKITSVKKCGRVHMLSEYVKNLTGNVGIGHTRWATHGAPTDANAHPHCSGGFAVVHNGIIENYIELKTQLLEDGFEFTSQTDSEVIVHLLEKNFKGDLMAALAETVKLLCGSYALMVMCEGMNGFAVAKYASPVIVGFGQGENFCASDEPALAGKCNEVCVPEDGDLVWVTAHGVEFYDCNLCTVKRKKFKNRARAASLSLNGCKHYMLKEIREVPASIKNTMSAFHSCKNELAQIFRGADRIIIVGCGTAFHAGLVGKYYIEKFARVSAEVQTAGEFRYGNPVVTSHTAVIAVSQSGETADTVEAAKLARSLGAKVIAVTNAPYSRLTRTSDVTVPVEAGPEICVAATKSYTCQIAALYLLSHVLAYGNSAYAEKILSSVPELCMQAVNGVNVSSLAHMCAASRGVYFIGREVDYAVALEGSLKLKEVSYISGEGYPAGELKHGTLALIDENTVCVMLMTRETLEKKCENAVYEVLSRGGKAAVITTLQGRENSFDGKVKVITLPECAEDASPYLTAVAVQKLAYETAVLLNRDPDKPRNLAKSVTVE